MELAWNQMLGMQHRCVQFIRRYFSRPADLVECIMQYRPSILHFGCQGTRQSLNLAFNSFVTNEQLADALENLNSGRTPVQLVVANERMLIERRRASSRRAPRLCHRSQTARQRLGCHRLQ